MNIITTLITLCHKYILSGTPRTPTKSQPPIATQSSWVLGLVSDFLNFSIEVSWRTWPRPPSSRVISSLAREIAADTENSPIESQLRFLSKYLSLMFASPTFVNLEVDAYRALTIDLSCLDLCSSINIENLSSWIFYRSQKMVNLSLSWDLKNLSKKQLKFLRITIPFSLLSIVTEFWESVTNENSKFLFSLRFFIYIYYTILKSTGPRRPTGHPRKIYPPPPFRENRLRPRHPLLHPPTLSPLFSPLLYFSPRSCFPLNG